MSRAWRESCAIITSLATLIGWCQRYTLLYRCLHLFLCLARTLRAVVLLRAHLGLACFFSLVSSRSFLACFASLASHSFHLTLVPPLVHFHYFGLSGFVFSHCLQWTQWVSNNCWTSHVLLLLKAVYLLFQWWYLWADPLGKLLHCLWSLQPWILLIIILGLCQSMLPTSYLDSYIHKDNFMAAEACLSIHYFLYSSFICLSDLSNPPWWWHGDQQCCHMGGGGTECLSWCCWWNWSAVVLSFTWSFGGGILLFTLGSSCTTTTIICQKCWPNLISSGKTVI